MSRISFKDLRQPAVGICLMALASGLALAGCDSDQPGVQNSAPEGMVLIDGGRFKMGIEHPMMPEGAPVHDVRVSPFYIGKTEVTNAEFAEFVEATGYVTVAERPIDPSDFPGVDESVLVPGSAVFESPSQPARSEDVRQWWEFRSGASWRRPEGPDSDIEQRMDHPVIHVAWEDATAYAEWVGGRLPTEAEWEFAARSGLEAAEFTWGDEPEAANNYLANTFQGDFPYNNTAADGYTAAAPVKSFPANGYGLYDMSGNVWEWVSDWYDPTYYGQLAAADAPADNPSGPPEAPGGSPPMKVQKGGSFLCTDQYCGRYRPGARGRGDPQTSSNHLGFRVAQDVASE